MKTSRMVLLGLVFLSLLAWVGSQYFHDYFKTTYTPEQLLKVILHNPKKALTFVHATYARVQKAVSRETNQQKIDELIKQYEKECPIFSLGECVEEGSGACVLSRYYDPRFREYFESAVVTAAAEKLKSNQTINYVGFGSGGMFQDLVILAKMLDKNPTAHIAINLIDPRYVCLKDSFDVTQLPKEVLCELPIHRSRKQQFISYLQKMFPEAVLSLSLYESTDAYVKYVEDNKVSYPDIITAADIEDEVSLLHRSFSHYIKLCLLSLRKNPALINLLLSKGKDFMNPSVITYSLNEIAGATKEEGLTGKLDYDKTIERVWKREQKI